MAVELQDDPASQIEEQRRRLSNALRTGAVENPDALAADRAEAARRGMPVTALRAVRQQNVVLPPVALTPDLPETSPRTSNFLSNPANAAVAHDDIENMSAVERIVARIGERTVRLAQGAGRASYTALAGPATWLEENLPRQVLSFENGRIVRRAISAEERRATGFNAQAQRLLDPNRLHTIEQGVTWEEFKERPLERLIPFALEEGVVSVPDMAAVMLNLPAYVTARTGEIGQERSENDGRENATVMDLVAALPAAAASALLDRLGARGILGIDDAVRGGLRGVPGAVGRAAGKEAVTEGLQEGIEYLGSNLGTEAGFNPADALERMAQGVIIGGPFGGTVRTVTATAEVAAQRFGAQETQAQAGEQAAETLQELAALAEASKLRERDPQTFQQFIEEASEGTPAENIYVDAETFAQSLNEAGVPLDAVLEAIPGLSDQLATAAETGGDLRISAGEFATHIAGTDAVGPLLPHLRTDPFAMSQAQAKEFMANRGDALQAEVEAAVTAATATEDARAGRERVQAKIAAELDTTGRFTSDVNRAYASLPSAFYDVMGARLGITAEQAAERYPLKFAAELPSSARANTLEQIETVEQIARDAESQGVRIDTTEGDNEIALNLIDTTAAGRKQGLGTAFMERLVANADATGRRVVLTPDASMGATSAGRLVKFYKRFGFKESKGRGRDFSTQAGMIREPVAGAEATFNQAEDVAPHFYSALERAVANSPTTKAPAAQWKATLAKTPGVKKEELEWSGLNEWLDAAGGEGALAGYTRSSLLDRDEIDAKGNIAKSAVLRFVKQGGVQVEETVLGENAGTPEPFAEPDDDWLETTAARLRVEDPELTEQEALSAAKDEWYEDATYEDLNPQFETDAQFSSYKLPGADDTYREILLTLPQIEGPSTHWDTENVVAHARVTMREDASGARVLFLEELQSDWHQQGRDEGYKTDASPEKIEEAKFNALEARRKLDSIAYDMARIAERTGEAKREWFGRPINDLGPYDKRRAYEGMVEEGTATPELTEIVMARAQAALVARETSIAYEALERGIPDAPFRNSWSALIMKRMIRYAVDNGAEKIAWINGNQQNGGQTGGDGSFFYERNLVNVANDLVKKYGTRVGPVDMLETTFGRQQYALKQELGEDTPERQAEDQQVIVASQEEVQDLYREAINLPMATPERVAAENALMRARMAQRENNPELVAAERRSEIRRHLYGRADPTRPATSLGIQNGFEITPALREAAQQGFALFQKNRGQIAFGADVSQTPSVISVLRAADLSTFVHETGHFFLEATAHMANQVDAPADIVADMATTLNWFQEGMTLADWNGMSLEERRPFHEKWARGFEAYHFEGKSPSLALRDVFRRFSAWLKNVYKSLTALDVELTEDVRAVMDRMLASEAEIAEMEQVRGFAPAFASKPEYATEDQWSEYQRLAGDATAEAIEQLEQRSARDMRWASGAKDRYVKAMQREADEQRKAIRAEVTAEVMAEPVNRARNFLRRGLGENGEPVEGAVKLDLATLKELYGDEGAWTALRRGGKYGEVSTDGAHPDIVAGMFGYSSGEAMIADLVNGENAADKIKGLTDQRMLERYGDLTDPQAIERAANEAVANDARAKFVAAEMAMADKAVGKKSILNEAARDFAAGVVNRLELKRLRPAQYLAAQGRAAKAAEKALKKDDLPAFAAAKRNQLINLHTGRAVMKAQADVEKNTRLFTRIVSAKDDAISRTRNMDLVNGARAILSLYGFGRVKNDPIGYMDALKRYDPVLYTDLEPFITAARASAKPIPDLTYEEFQGLRDVVGQLWALSRRVNQVERDGKLVDLKTVTAAMETRLEEIGIPENRPGTRRAITDSEKRDFDLLSVRAALRRVESWARGIDGANSGPFRANIWNPVSEGADNYRAESGVYIKRFRALLDTVRDELKPRDIAAPELGYTFGGKSELYHALLHTGNGSNKSKLLLGRNWGKRDPDGMLDDSRWQTFLDRLHADGTLTAKDWNFVQAVWDMLEDTKAGAQKAHRTVYGRYFDEVAADPVDTPFGQYRGGYVPALTDQNLVQDAALRAEQEAIEGGDSAMFPAASNGFTKSRVEDYTRELALDLRLIPSHVDKVLKFTHLGPPVRDVMRILKNRDFSAKLQAFDPTAQTDLLLPWLNRAAKQIVETPSKGRAGKWADRAFSYIRSNVGMQLMFANAVNTLQQLTGFSGVMLRVKASHVNGALWRYTRDPAGVTETATKKSVFLRNRSDTNLFEARQAITQLVKLNPNGLDKVRDFSSRHAYFAQSALQNVMDVVAWSASYDQAVTGGETDLEAIRFADSVIRETQGSMAPEDISRLETGTPFVRVFTQFYGYFNMMANLAGTEVQQVARGVGLRKGAGRLFYVYVMTLLIPAVIGDAIAQGLRGGWEDEEDDGILNDLIPWFFGSQAKFALATVPGVGQLANATMGAFTKQPYDDRVSMSASVSVVEGTLGVPAAIYETVVEGETFNRNDVRDVFNLLGIISGTPANVLGKPVGYGVGVAQGDIEPTGPLDAARGFFTGTPSPESKTN